MSKNKYNGKIGFVYNSSLNIRDKNNQIIPGGHYVYIHKDNGSTVDVNVITSLEDNKGNFTNHKLNKVKYGKIYPIPKNDSNLTRWSGISLKSIKNINKKDVLDLDKKKIKKRHKLFVGLFHK